MCGFKSLRTKPPLSTAARSMDVFMWSFWMNDEQRERAEQYIQDSYSHGSVIEWAAYQNYPNRSTPPDLYPQLYWGDNTARLQTVKAKYDPTNVFQFPQMVHPPSPRLSP